MLSSSSLQFKRLIHTFIMSSDPLVQYIVVRGDLQWPTGALIGQGSHASVAAIATTLHHEDTKSYLKDLENMHKVVLKAENEKDLQDLVQKLRSDGIAHSVWIEKPENVFCSLATAPTHKSLVKQYFKKFKLFA